MYLNLTRSSVKGSHVARVFFGKSSVVPSLKSVLKEDASLKASDLKWDLKLVSSVSLSSVGCRDLPLGGNGFLYVLSCKRPGREMVDSDLRMVALMESMILRVLSTSAKSASTSNVGLVGVWFMDGWVSLSTWSYWKSRLVERPSSTWLQGLHLDSYSRRSGSYSGLLMSILMLQSSLEEKK